MSYFGMKAVKAFAFGVVMSGLAVACNEAGQVAKTIVPEAEAVNVSAGKGIQSTQLTALQRQELNVLYEFRTLSVEQREQKKREFVAQPDVIRTSQGLDELAQMIAVAVEDKQLRDRIYEKCLEKFDGATNTLWKHLEEDSKLRINGGWNNRLKALADKRSGNSIVRSIGNLESAIAKYERTLNAPLHIFWAFPENWDRKTTPLVGFRAIGAKGNSITAYDSKGISIQAPKEIAEKRPVLVIAFNERTMLDGSLKRSVNFVTNTKPSSLQSAGDITLSQAWFSTGQEFGKTIEQFYDEYDEGPPEFTCEVFPLASSGGAGSPRLQDNTLGNISLGGWVDVKIPSLYPPYFSPAVIANWGSNNAVFVKYWEDDWWFFDDFVGEHPIPKNPTNTHEHTESNKNSPQYNPKARYTW